MATTPTTAGTSRQAAQLSGLGVTVGVSILLWLVGAVSGQFALLLAGVGVFLLAGVRAAISRGERREMRDAGIMALGGVVLAAAPWIIAALIPA